MSFNALGLPERFSQKLIEQKYSAPYPIQEKAIPAILAGNDVLGIAQTGSGKTASYVLPILANLHTNKSFKKQRLNKLVLVPTRELAIQVCEVFEQFLPVLKKPIKAVAVYGGVSKNPQMIAVKNANILVATPGRLLDLVASNAIHLDAINTLVLDEADKMLNLGFKEEMDKILSLLPNDRQNLLFSATMSSDVDTMSQLVLHNPLSIEIEAEQNAIDKIHQFAYFVSEANKGPLLRYLIKAQNLTQVLVFTSSARKADNVANKLFKNKIDATAIHGKKSQTARINALNKFKEGKLRVLVTTDLLSRGIDIEFLPHVINYELPRSPKDYIHRIGRTGRAEATGEAISLVTPAEEHHFKVIQKKMGKWATIINSEHINLQGF